MRRARYTTPAMVSVVVIGLVAFLGIPALVGHFLNTRDAREGDREALARTELGLRALAERLGLALASTDGGTFRLVGARGTMAVTLRVSVTAGWSGAHLTVMTAGLLPEGTTIRTEPLSPRRHVVTPPGQLPPGWTDALVRWHPIDVALAVEPGCFAAATSVRSLEELEDFTRSTLDTLTVLTQTSAYR